MADDDMSDRPTSHAAKRREKAAELRRLQLSLQEIALLLDAIEGRPHLLLRKSAERLIPKHAKRGEATSIRAESLASYTQRFATSLVKANVSFMK